MCKYCQISKITTVVVGVEVSILVKMEHIREFMMNSQFHGFRFISQQGRPLVERFLWFLCVAFSWYLSCSLFTSYWESYRSSPVSFVTETDYAHWNTALFCVSVCEDQNDKKIEEFTKSYYGDHYKEISHMKEVMLEIAFFKGTGAFINRFCIEINGTCPYDNLVEIANGVRSPCHGIFHKCFWMEKAFNCCDHFLPIETELGLCYSVNSLQTRYQNPLEMVSNRRTGIGTLNVFLKETGRVYIHAPEEVPFLNAGESQVLVMSSNIFKQYTFRVLETVNEPLVRQVPIEKRKCRFHDENNLTIYRNYGWSACVVQCRMEIQIELCNCSTHLMNFTKNPCDLRGLRCLQENLSKHLPLTSLTQCDHCLPSCTEIQYDPMQYETYGGEESMAGLSEMELSFEELPTVRLKRQVVRSTLDLVVSIGGCAGLFIGASMLSFVEVFYYFFIRPLQSRLRKSAEKRENGPVLSYYE